ncbi:MAG: VOC family protein [Bacteroidales bacterium]|nr:MAG: VOC family protein [Bacteroidales bacterium]
MQEVIISGIQQIGIGVPNVHEAWKWYRKHFGMDIRIFEENASADLMLNYTGGKPVKRHAALALNLQGGGGFEIWQYTERIPQPPAFDIAIGDFGIFAAKMKCRDVRATLELFKSNNHDINGEIRTDPRGKEYFFVKDPYGNLFQMEEGYAWFKNEKKPTGASSGVIIGVSNIEKSRVVYSEILGYDEVLFDNTAVFDDLSGIPGGDSKIRRVLLKHSKNRMGGFSRLFGPSHIELIQSLERKPQKIYEGRYWGDLGFIHLCYDIHGMEILKEACESKGYPFTVDSFENFKGNSFDMGEAAGHFSYIEDPDGTLIEFVETHKIPIFKKIGWYLNLKKRDPKKALPDWLLKSLKFQRVRD